MRFEDGFQGWVGIGDGLATRAAVEIGIHHLSDDRARADDGDLDHQVVEALGLHAGQRRHLGAALDLEGADGVGATNHLVGGRDRRRAGGRGRPRRPSWLRIEFEGVLDRGQHAEPSRSILMIPRSAQSSLSHCTTRRSAIVAGSMGTISSRRPAEMTTPPVCCPRCLGRPRTRSTRSSSAAMRGAAGSTPACSSKARASSSRLSRCSNSSSLEIVLGQAIDGVGCHAEHLAHLSHGHARAVGDHHRRHGGAVSPVFVEDVLDDLLALVARGQIEIDVGPLAALFGEEALEEQIHPHRVDGGDAERVTHSAVGRGAAPLGPGSSGRARTARCRGR